MDSDKWSLAIRERRCWVCGDALGKYLTFVLGSMCGVNRTTQEPPCHLDCAEWSARNCPFLSRPNMVRREVDQTNPHLAALNMNPAGNAIDRNPGVTLLWTTRTYCVFQVDGSIPGSNPGQLIRIGDPVAIRAYRDGRVATRAEIEESTNSGLPKLLEVAEWQGDDAIRELEKSRAAFSRTLDQFVPMGAS
jgi:hypothetical protein